MDNPDYFNDPLSSQGHGASAHQGSDHQPAAGQQGFPKVFRGKLDSIGRSFGALSNLVKFSGARKIRRDMGVEGPRRLSQNSVSPAPAARADSFLASRAGIRRRGPQGESDDERGPSDTGGGGGWMFARRPTDTRDADLSTSRRGPLFGGPRRESSRTGGISGTFNSFLERATGGFGRDRPVAASGFGEPPADGIAVSPAGGPEAQSGGPEGRLLSLYKNSIFAGGGASVEVHPPMTSALPAPGARLPTVPGSTRDGHGSFKSSANGSARGSANGSAQLRARGGGFGSHGPGEGSHGDASTSSFCDPFWSQGGLPSAASYPAAGGGARSEPAEDALNVSGASGSRNEVPAAGMLLPPKQSRRISGGAGALEAVGEEGSVRGSRAYAENGVASTPEAGLPVPALIQAPGAASLRTDRQSGPRTGLPKRGSAPESLSVMPPPPRERPSRETLGHSANQGVPRSLGEVGGPGRQHPRAPVSRPSQAAIMALSLKAASNNRLPTLQSGGGPGYSAGDGSSDPWGRFGRVGAEIPGSLGPSGKHASEYAPTEGGRTAGRSSFGRSSFARSSVGTGAATDHTPRPRVSAETTRRTARRSAGSSHQPGHASGSDWSGDDSHGEQGASFDRRRWSSDAHAAPRPRISIPTLPRESADYAEPRVEDASPGLLARGAALLVEEQHAPNQIETGRAPSPRQSFGSRRGPGGRRSSDGQPQSPAAMSPSGVGLDGSFGMLPPDAPAVPRASQVGSRAAAIAAADAARRNISRREISADVSVDDEDGSSDTYADGIMSTPSQRQNARSSDVERGGLAGHLAAFFGFGRAARSRSGRASTSRGILRGGQGKSTDLNPRLSRVSG